MVDADKPQFLAVLNGLAAVKPGAKLTPESLELWWHAMSGWDIADFRSAAAELVKRHEFMPNPYHFEQLRRKSCETAGEAFGRARAHARTLPVSGGFLQEQPTGDDLLDSVARAVGGYRAIANASERDLQFLERRFAEHFETISDAETTRQALPNLAGPGGTWGMAKLLAGRT